MSNWCPCHWSDCGCEEGAVRPTPAKMDIAEQIELALSSLVGCFLVCDRCGHGNDCSDLDAVMFLKRAKAVLASQTSDRKP